MSSSVWDLSDFKMYLEKAWSYWHWRDFERVQSHGFLTSETRNFEPVTISGDKFRKGFAFRERFQWLLNREEKGGAGWGVESCVWKS